MIDVALRPAGIQWPDGSPVQSVMERIALAGRISVIARLPDADAEVPGGQATSLSDVAEQLHALAGYRCLYDAGERLAVFQLPLIATTRTSSAARYKERLELIELIPSDVLPLLRGAWSIGLDKLPENAQKAIVDYFARSGFAHVGAVSLEEQPDHPLLRLSIDPIVIARVAPRNQHPQEPTVRLSGLLPLEPLFMSYDPAVVTGGPARPAPVWPYHSRPASWIGAAGSWPQERALISLDELADIVRTQAEIELRVDRRLAGARMLVLGPSKALNRAVNALLDAGGVGVRRVEDIAFLTFEKYAQVLDAQAYSRFEEVVAQTYRGEFSPFTMEDVLMCEAWEWEFLTEDQRDRILQAVTRNWSLVSTGDIPGKDTLRRAFAGARVRLFPALDVYLLVGDGQSSVSEAHIDIMPVAAVAGG